MFAKYTKIIVRDPSTGSLVQILPEVKTATEVDAESSLPVTSSAVASWGEAFVRKGSESETISGDVTFEGRTTYSDDVAMSGHKIVDPSGIELSPSSNTDNNGGYIDFRYNNAEESTSKIIESASGTVTINNVNISNGSVSAATFTGALNGNAATTTKLATARTINGASFDGTGNITTTSWGTARNISISDSDGTNTGAAVSVNGSGNATLKLPTTIKAGITGNASTATKLATARNINGTSFDGSAAITTANWGTARNISISDADGTNTGDATSVNGSAAVTLSFPSTIKASLEGNATSADSVPWSGVTGKPSTFAPSSHNQASNTINAMTGYSKPSSTGAIATTDSLNAAIGKLEKALDGKQASGSYAAASHNHDASNINSGTLNAARIPNLDASKITSGTIDIARLPAGALERLVPVADQTARFALTANDVQLGDTVRQEDTGLMYYVVDTSKLSSAAGYAVYTAGAATSVPWSGVTDKPSTYAPSSHNQASNTINAMTGYSKPSSTSAIGTSDTLNAAIGKLEKALDGKQASGSYAAASHNQASSTINAMTGYSKPSSTSAIGTSDTLNAAIGKLEKALDGKAASATTLAGYNISDAKIASGVITLGSSTITPLTSSSSLNAAKLTGTAAVNTTGNAATVTGTAGTSALAWNSEVTLYTVGGNAIKAKLPANPNTDVKVRQDVGTTNTERPILSRFNVSDASQTAGYAVYDTGVTNNPNKHTLTASGGFVGKLSGTPEGTTFVAAVTEGKALVNATTTGYGGIWNAPTKNYRVGCSTYPSSGDDVRIAYSVTNANVTAGTNTVAKSLTWNADSGTLTATAFSGPLTGNVTGNVSGSSGSCTGNAATATKLATARAINGTNFDGSAAITTANWGTARNISISDSDGTNTGTAVSVNGSANATLKLPATIKASITGNCSGSSGSCTGNAATATKTTATIAVDTTGELVRATMGSNDVFRIAVGGASNAGWAELATGDDYNEPIYVRQYQGSFATLKRTATLLDASGNTSFPGTVTAIGFSGPLTGNVTGNCSGSSGSCTGNAATATKLATARSINVQDSSATNTGTAASFDGSGNATIKLPATIKATITGNCSGSSGSCTGNAATATKLATARTINGVSFDGSANITVADSTKVAKSGDTMTGQLTMGSSQAIHFKNTNITRGTAPSASQYPFYILLKDNADKTLGGLYYEYLTDKSAKSHLMCYQGTTNANTWKSIGIGYDASGNPYTWSITPGFGNNSTQIATTEFVWKNAAKHMDAATNIYVAKAATGNGSGSNTSNYMSLADLRNYLATVHMHSSTADLNGAYNLQILFKAGDSFGNATFDATKMPGVRNLILNTSTGTASTTSNYSTNSPTFGNITVTGDIAVTIRNINCTGRISAQWGAYISIDTYVGASSFSAINNGYLNVAKNMTINVCDAHTDYLFNASSNGIIAMWPGATVTLNFRQQCYYTRALFVATANGTMWLGYSSLKLTGTQPIAVWGGSGTLTGTSGTAAGTAAKAVTLASGQTFTLKTNATAKVKFTNDNTAANPTLNINSTGAKALWWNGAAVTANMIMKNITYDVKYDGTHFVIQNAVKRLTNNDFGIFRSSGNYNQTYNSGSWNFTGWSLYYGTGVENGNWRGSHIGNIQQNVTTSDNTFPILFSGTANATANTSTYPYFGSGVKINPKTSTIYATTFSGNAPTPAAADNSTKIATTAWVRGRLHISKADPSGGTDGDIWFKYA